MSGGYGSVLDRLAAGACVILDGGIGTELPRGARATVDARRAAVGHRRADRGPRRGAGVHRRYLTPAATSSPRTRWGLASAAGRRRPRGCGSRPAPCTGWTSRGAGCASRARRSRAGRDGECAVAFSLNGDVDSPEGAETIRLLARLFADEPPDLILLETLSLVRPSLDATIEALLATGLPVWLSFRRCRHGLCGVYGQHWGGPEGDAFGRAARRFEEMGVGALLDQLHPARPRRRDGRLPARLHRPAARRVSQPRLLHRTRLALRRRRRRRGVRRDGAAAGASEGAQIIGGCCGVGPEHIAAVREARCEALRPGAGGRGRRPSARRERPPRRAAAPRLDRPPRGARSTRCRSRTSWSTPASPRRARPATWLALPVPRGHRRAPALPGRRLRHRHPRRPARPQRRRARARARHRRAGRANTLANAFRNASPTG